MRYRLMASYLGASYQAAVGPTDHDVTLFAAPPPPEEHGFSPAPGGIWRKQVRLNDLGALWESRPIGSYHGEPCLVLDDLGDRLHIVYLGMDEQRAAQLGYWEVDRGVFEVVVPRHDVTDLAEERHEFPIALLLSALPRALGAGDPGAGHGFGQNGTAMAAGGVGPGGATGWNGPAGAPQPARGQLPAGGPTQNQQAQLPPGQLPPGQLPAARPQPPAMAGQQFPPTGPYQLPGGPERGAGLPGAPGPVGSAGQLGARGAAPLGEAPQQGSAQQPPAGQPAPGGQQFPGMAAGQATPYGPGAQPGAPGVQGALPPGMSQALPPAGPQPLPGRPQLPMAQQAPGTQPPLGTQPSAGMQPPLAAQSPGTRQSPGTSQSPAAQQQFAQQFPSPLAGPQGPGPQGPGPGPQGPGPQGPGTGQGTGPQQTVPTPSPQPQQPQAMPEPPAAAAAWHGSPAPDGNGTWYFQPGPDPQQGGAAAGGYPANAMPSVNGIPQNSYPQPDQSTGQVGASGGLAGMQQYAQQAPQSPAAYRQGPAAAEQTRAGQPAPQATLTSAAPQAPAGPAPQFLPHSPTAQQAPTQAPLSAGPPTGAAGLAQPPVMQAPAMTPVSSTIPPVTTSAAPPAPASPARPAAAPLAAPSAPPAAAAADATWTSPLGPMPSAPATGQQPQAPATGQQPSVGMAAGALGKLTGAVRGRRAARKPRLAMSAIFADLVDMADIPRSAYAVDDEVTGAMCLFKTEGGYEVFSCAEDARHEVRFFEEEESAYFYLFGVLAAEALRNGRLTPRRG